MVASWITRESRCDQPLDTMLPLGNQEATKAEAAHFAVMLKMRLFLDTFLLLKLLLIS